MAVGQIGESGAAVVWHAVVELKHACVLAPILPQPIAVLIAKGLVSSHNLATQMDAQVISPFVFPLITWPNKWLKVQLFFKSMAAGQTGGPGAAAVQHVVEETKYEHGPVPIPLLAVEALIVKEPARSLSRATVTHAQVRVVIRGVPILN